jgi:hypothetical protein
MLAHLTSYLTISYAFLIAYRMTTQYIIVCVIKSGRSFSRPRTADIARAQSFDYWATARYRTRSRSAYSPAHLRRKTNSQIFRTLDPNTSKIIEIQQKLTKRMSKNSSKYTHKIQHPPTGTPNDFKVRTELLTAFSRHFHLVLKLRRYQASY